MAWAFLHSREGGSWGRGVGLTTLNLSFSEKEGWLEKPHGSSGWPQVIGSRPMSRDAPTALSMRGGNSPCMRMTLEGTKSRTPSSTCCSTTSPSRASSFS